VPEEKARPSRTRATKQAKTTDVETKKPRARKPKMASAPPSETIAFHAYLLWRAGEPGDATEHWLRAERELVAA
jgi:Protein of unknown function (DUF2934)